jgi:ParB-like chromosome segregation protein Spo0J
MAVVHIDTMEQFMAARPSLVPVFINSKTHGRVLVPCANTILVRPSLIAANLYNPNSVSDDKMELLKQSILDNGFAFPVVAICDDDQQRFVVIDGFHRTTIGGPDWLDFDYVPVAVLDHDITKRMAATVQFNKARGVHQVDLDAEVIRALIEQGVSEDDISQRLGIDMETIHRYKQLTGVAELFKNSDYSLSWEMAEVDE